jgi:hypothetical protein
MKEYFNFQVGHLDITIIKEKEWNGNRLMWSADNDKYTGYIETFEIDPCKQFLKKEKCIEYIKKQILKSSKIFVKELTE